MKPLPHRIFALCAVALAVVLFVAINIVANQWLGTARLDLTQNGLYTVSPGTQATLARIGIGRIPEEVEVPAALEPLRLPAIEAGAERARIRYLMRDA